MHDYLLNGLAIIRRFPLILVLQVSMHRCTGDTMNILSLLCSISIHLLIFGINMDLIRKRLLLVYQPMGIRFGEYILLLPASHLQPLVSTSYQFVLLIRIVLTSFPSILKSKPPFLFTIFRFGFLVW